MKDKRYIIVKCEPLNDPYECDAERKVIGITDDISLWSRIYTIEINEIQADGTVVKIKDYENGCLYINGNTLETHESFAWYEYYCDLTDEMKLFLNQTEQD